MLSALSAGLPRLSPSQQDCHATANIDRAEHELHRAVDRGTEADRAVWASRWGQPLIDAAKDPRQEEVEPEAVDTSDAEAELDELKACIDTALEELGDGPASAAARLQLVDALQYVGKVRKELEKL